MGGTLLDMLLWGWLGHYYTCCYEVCRWDTAIHAVMGVGGWDTAIHALK